MEDSSWQAAFRHFRAALDLDPARDGYLVNCVAMFQVRKENQAGIDFLSRYPKLLAASGELNGIMGTMHEELGRYQEAKTYALKALELDPEETEWLINLSDALWGLGERVHSKNVLLRRHAEKPSFRLSVYLASTYLGLEEYENAKRVLQAAHKDTLPSPKSVEYYLRALIRPQRVRSRPGLHPRPGAATSPPRPTTTSSRASANSTSSSTGSPSRAPSSPSTWTRPTGRPSSSPPRFRP